MKMIPSNYKVTLAIIAFYLTLNIAVETKSEPVPSNPQVKQCLDGIATVFEYTYQVLNGKNYCDLTAKKCLEIAIKKFNFTSMNIKYAYEAPDRNDTTKLGYNYYSLLVRMLDTTNVQTPKDFCENQACIDELKSICSEKSMSYTCVEKLYKETIDYSKTYTNLYIQHVLDNITVYDLDDVIGATEPIKYCNHTTLHDLDD